VKQFWWVDNHHIERSKVVDTGRERGQVSMQVVEEEWDERIYFPDSFNDLIYAFALAEEETAYGDEKAFNEWYYGGGFGLSVPTGITNGTPPTARYGTNERNLRANLNASIDKAEGLTAREKAVLKSYVQDVIKKTANRARAEGSDRLYRENPTYKDRAGPLHSLQRNTARQY